MNLLRRAERGKLLRRNRRAPPVASLAPERAREWGRRRGSLTSSLPRMSMHAKIRAAMKVCVADNSALLRKQIIGVLSELRGVEIVGEAQAAPDALRAIRELKPDVVTLDIQMSDGGGIDVLKKIKRDDSAPIVIVLTNSTSPPYRKSSVEAGADFFLDKSTEFKEMRGIMQSLLERFNSTGAGAARDCVDSGIQ